MRATGEAFCLLDKDTLYGRYSSAAMGALTENPNDRDSPLYLKHLRDPEYQGLLDTARENLALGIGALVVGRCRAKCAIAAFSIARGSASRPTSR